MTRFIYITVLISLLLGCADESNRDNPILLEGFYFIETIDVIEDIQVFHNGTQLLIRGDGEISFPVHYGEDNWNADATYRIVEGDSLSFLEVTSKDSTLDGRWRFNEIKFMKDRRSKRLVREFEIQNNYYIMECTLMKTGL